MLSTDISAEEDLASSFRTLSFSHHRFISLCLDASLKNFCTPLSGAPQKCFQSDPSLANAGPDCRLHNKLQLSVSQIWNWWQIFLLLYLLFVRRLHKNQIQIHIQSNQACGTRGILLKANKLRGLKGLSEWSPSEGMMQRFIFSNSYVNHTISVDVIWNSMRCRVINDWDVLPQQQFCNSVYVGHWMIFLNFGLAWRPCVCLRCVNVLLSMPVAHRQ